MAVVVAHCEANQRITACFLKINQRAKIIKKSSKKRYKLMGNCSFVTLIFPNINCKTVETINSIIAKAKLPRKL